MFYIIILLIAFAIYVIYTHSETRDANGNVTQAQVLITPNSVGLEAMDVAGKIAGGSWTAGKRSISWSAERNALGETSLVNSGWRDTKGFTKGYDVAEQATNTFIDSTWFELDAKPAQGSQPKQEAATGN